MKNTAETAVPYYGGFTGIIGGAVLLKTALDKRAEAQVNADMLQELGASAEAAISPYTMELENQVLQLQGSVDVQYEELRRILKLAYYEELGLVLPDAPEQGADAPGDDASEEEPGDAEARTVPDDGRLQETAEDTTHEQSQDETLTDAPAPTTGQASQRR